MAEKREVKCNGCGHTWSSGAKAENLRCRKCGSNESFSIPDDVPDSQDAPIGEGTPAEVEESWQAGDRCRVEFDEGIFSGEILSIETDGTANIVFDDGDEGFADIDDLMKAGKRITIANRLKKRNTFLADAVRDQRDDEFLNREISKREYKGKLLRVTRIKEYVVSADGYWVTNFIIDLKG